MNIDPSNPVVALCAAGMTVDGDVAAAQRLFEQAWAARQDDYDASIAAHFMARHQPTPEARAHWNRLAVEHAESVANGRTQAFKASLYLNLADSYFALGDHAAAVTTLDLAHPHVSALPDDGYRAFVERGIAGLQSRLAAGESVAPKI
ncbi:MAG: hypothetical protein ABJA80_10975 [bacterium]